MYICMYVCTHTHIHTYIYIYPSIMCTNGELPHIVGVTQDGKPVVVRRGGDSVNRDALQVRWWKTSENIRITLECCVGPRYTVATRYVSAPEKVVGER